MPSSNHIAEAVDDALRGLPRLTAPDPGVIASPLLHTVMAWTNHGTVSVAVDAHALDPDTFCRQPVDTLLGLAAGVQRAALAGLCTDVRGYALQLPTTNPQDPGTPTDGDVIMYGDYSGRVHEIIRAGAGQRPYLGGPLRRSVIVDILDALRAMADMAATPSRHPTGGGTAISSDVTLPQRCQAPR